MDDENRSKDEGYLFIYLFLNDKDKDSSFIDMSCLFYFFQMSCILLRMTRAESSALMIDNVF